MVTDIIGVIYHGRSWGNGETREETLGELILKVIHRLSMWIKICVPIFSAVQTKF